MGTGADCQNYLERKTHVHLSAKIIRTIPIIMCERNNQSSARLLTDLLNLTRPELKFEWVIKDETHRELTTL